MKTHLVKVRNLIVVTIAIALALPFIDTASAADAPKPLRLAYSAITVNQAIPWISLDAGHFKKKRARR